MFEINERFVRVQCKSGKRRGDVIIVPTRTSRHTPRGYVRTKYAASEVDAIAVYCHETGSCYLLPIEDVRGRWEIRLRLAPARNNQEFAITYAERYAFLGAIAQLGERVTGSHEVAGSSPASSTKRKGRPLGRPFFVLDAAAGSDYSTTRLGASPQSCSSR